MITEMADLEQVLDRYGPGTVVLVGPLLTLAISDYRYFYVAGRGDKICQSIGLGFTEPEDNSQHQYSDHRRSTHDGQMRRQPAF